MTTHELSWEPLSPAVRLPQSDTLHDDPRTTACLDLEYYDMSAASYNHHEPHISRSPKPLSTPFQRQDPELSHHHSTDSVPSIAEGVSTHCPSCGLISLPDGLLAGKKGSHICADIAREKECPDTHIPSPAQRRASLSRNSPTYHRRRHSGLYEPASQETALHFEPLEPKHELGQQESGLLEQKSNLSEQEASLIGQVSSSLDQGSDPSQQELHHTHNNGTHFYAHSLASLATPLELESNPIKLEPHHLHDKDTDFYAHTLSSLVTPLEEDSSTNEQLSDPFDPDIHAINEASPTDNPYYQNPSARLSLEHTKQEDWKNHCMAQRAERQLRFGPGWVSPAETQDLYADEMEEEQTRHGHRHGETGLGPMRKQYYGKHL